jgi:hypothetical protein
VRIRRHALWARVNPDLPITFSEERISAHGGLEVFFRFLAAIDLRGRLAQAFRGFGCEGDYGAARFVRCVIGLLLVGGRRIAHLRVLERDPVFLRFAGLRQLPRDRTLVRWMKRLPFPVLERLATMIRDLVYDTIAWARLPRLTIDLDGTVLRTGLLVEGAARGFNPHHPKDKSYYPLTAHLAQTGQILRVTNRPGDVNDSTGAAGFLRTVVGELRERFGRRMPLELRLDGGFFYPKILAFLVGEGLDFSIKVPLWQWLGVRERISAQRRWTRVDASVSAFETTLPIPQWNLQLRVCVYRKRVQHRTRKNFQLDLFSPDDGHYEYSAIATSKALSVRGLWHFMAGRGGHEKTLAELKQHLALDAIPTNDWVANSLWQQLGVLTHNLIRAFQLCTGALPRKATWKRTARFVFPSLQTERFELIDQPARLVRPAGRPELRFAVSPATRRRIERTLQRIQRLERFAA